LLEVLFGSGVLCVQCVVDQRDAVVPAEDAFRAAVAEHDAALFVQQDHAGGQAVHHLRQGAALVRDAGEHSVQLEGTCQVGHEPVREGEVAVVELAAPLLAVGDDRRDGSPVLDGDQVAHGSGGREIANRAVGGSVYKGKFVCERGDRVRRAGHFSKEGIHAVAPEQDVDSSREAAVGSGEGGQVERERDGGAVQRLRQSLHDALPEPELRRGVVDPSYQVEGAQVRVHDTGRRSTASMREALAGDSRTVPRGNSEKAGVRSRERTPRTHREPGGSVLSMDPALCRVKKSNAGSGPEELSRPLHAFLPQEILVTRKARGDRPPYR
jgi:hypothetical protein